MKEILRSKDMFRITLARQLLEHHGISSHVFDEGAGTLYAGGMFNVYPRLMVMDEDVERALELIKEAETS